MILLYLLPYSIDDFSIYLIAKGIDFGRFTSVVRLINFIVYLSSKASLPICWCYH